MKWNPLDRNSGFVFFISVVAAFGGLLFGFDTGVISGAILFINQQFHLTAFTNGLVVSSVLMGACVGAFVSGLFSNALGRRNSLILTACIFIVSTFISAISPNVTILILSRAAVGVAIGIASFTTPVYISEVAPPKYRGMLVTLNQLLVTMGIVAAYIVDFDFAGRQEWRFMLGAGIVPAIFLLVGMFFSPQSPRWLMMKGLNHRAEKILELIRGSKNVHEEINSIKESMIERSQDWRLIFQKSVRPLLVIGFGLAILQQFAGINTIIYYAPTILESAGFHSNTSAILATLGVGVINVLFTIISIPLIDWVGRRPLLIIGCLGMAVCLFFLGISFDAHSMILKWLALGGMLCYIPFFAISLGPILWLMIAEIFPLEIRGLGSSLCSTVNWGANMLVALTFLTLIQLISSSGTFFLYGIVCVLGCLFVYFYIPETKGVSLEKIEKNLKAKKKCRHLGV